MTEKSGSNRSLSDRLLDVELIERALRKAVREALRQHKVAGNPIAISRDGQVVWLRPDEIPDSAADEDR